MIDTPTLIGFTLLNMSFACIPGPDVLCIVSNAIAHGAKAGYLVCLGIATACLFHVACATLGLTAILAAIPSMFLLVKALGAGYLIWLGCQMVRRPFSHADIAETSRLRAPFVQGALSNLFNPKIAIFFLSILPQFVRPEHGRPGLQVLVLGLVSIVSGTIVNLFTATLGAKARGFLLTRESWFRRFQQTSGLILIALAARVAVDRAR